jgi:hypothetical protein
MRVGNFVYVHARTHAHTSTQQYYLILQMGKFCYFDFKSVVKMGYELRLRCNIYMYSARWDVGIHSFVGTQCRGVFQFADINRMIMNVIMKY